MGRGCFLDSRAGVHGTRIPIPLKKRESRNPNHQEQQLLLGTAPLADCASLSTALGKDEAMAPFWFFCIRSSRETSAYNVF